MVEQLPARFLPPRVQISNAIREFLVDVNRLTRIYITRTLFRKGEQPSKEAVNARFARAAAELRDLLVQYYGEDISNQIQSDFETYIYYIEQLIDAYATNDETAIVQNRNTLYYLANRFAQTYALANNFLDRDVIQALFYQLIDLVENQIVSIKNEDYARDLEEYDTFMDVSYRLADEFTYGLLRQYFYDVGQ